MKTLLRVGVPVLFLMAADAAQAYEKDVHFSLTFAVSRMAGFTYTEALEIASANERVDENDTTAASMVIAFEKDSFEARKRRNWHALDDSREAVMIRRDELWTRAAGGKNLVYFGQYLHFLQDTFSHREVKGEEWKPYGWSIGHAMKGHQPDRVPADLKLAEEMTLATLEAASRFRSEVLLLEPLKWDAAAPGRLVSSLASAYSKDALGYWNEADAFKAPIKLEEALLSLGYAEPHVPHVGLMMRMKFDRNGELVPPPTAAE